MIFSAKKGQSSSPLQSIPVVQSSDYRQPILKGWRGLKQHITVMIQDGNLVKFVGFKEVIRDACVCVFSCAD